MLHTQATHGRAEADAFLISLRLDRDDLEDETRLVPVELWHAALVAFASRFGRDEILAIMPSVIHPENIGVWTRVLRGADTPEQAYRQLGNYGADAGTIERWTTHTSSPQGWTGRVAISQSSRFERDGLFKLARAAELASIPLLFGLPPAQITPHPDARGDAQEFSARWHAPGRTLPFTLAAAGAVGATALAWLGAREALDVAVWLGAGLVLGAGLGRVLGQQRLRSCTVSAQSMRIQVLERAASLREGRIAGSLQLQSGSVIAAQYRLGESLGSGASGSIWEAERISDGSMVAIKLLRTAIAHDTVAADRLRREAAALGLAWHPNVVEVYEDGVLPDGTSYLVMERLYGESLALRLKRLGTLDPEELLPIVLQVCDALGAVHAAGVVHRDLKPSNIFLARELEHDSAPSPNRVPLATLPASERVKLLDFGVAQVAWAETRLTNSGAPLGTPGYMSPEQEQGSEIDHRSDIFALGGVIYECLTGSAPPLGSSATAPLASPIEHERAESGTQPSLKQLPTAWRDLIAKAMAFHPRDRFADWRQLKEALLQTEAHDDPLAGDHRA